MHIETLQTFCDLVATGSFSRAARMNRVSQSAVSQQVQALERRYGKRLLERSPRAGATPTEAGKILYDEIRPLLGQFDALEDRLRERANVVSGVVRVATVYSVGLHTLPKPLKKFLGAHPEVKVRLEYRRTDQVYDACIGGDADLGIVALPAARPQLIRVPLRDEELVLVVPPDHHLARGRVRRLSDLEGVPFIGFERDIPTRRIIDRELRRHGVTTNVVMELDNIETIKRSIEAGLGVSILPLPALGAEVRARSLVIRRFSDATLHRPIGIIHRRGRELSNASTAFLSVVQRELG